jgi:3-deoxy-D-manno-octulosonate 8-phosphate phosphatase (KDO 8-P phosphatase)
MYLKDIVSKFTETGAQFLMIPETLAFNVKGVKAFIFDWDGVFNDGQKNENGTSNFNEIDSMGVNLLRFSYWLNYKRMPLTAVISGERNSASFYWTNREHFTSCYYKIAKKADALQHFCALHKLKPSEVAFVFDDVLDLSIAKLVGVRIFISRKANPLFNEYVVKNKLADYITANESNHYAVREICEMIMGLQDNYDKVVSERVSYSPAYKTYIESRNSMPTNYYTKQDESIVELNPTS